MRPTYRHLFTIDCDLGPTVDVGPTPTGHRRVFPIVGGTVRGALAGVILPGGADWNLVRPDGSVELWARYELRLDDGAVVSVCNTALHRADAPAPILTTPRFDVADGGPVWLRTGVYLGVLDPPGDEPRVGIEVYEVTVAPAGSVPPGAEFQ